MARAANVSLSIAAAWAAKSHDDKLATPKTRPVVFKKSRREGFMIAVDRGSRVSSRQTYECLIHHCRRATVGRQALSLPPDCLARAIRVSTSPKAQGCSGNLERGCVRRTSRSRFKRCDALNYSGAIFRSHLLRLGLCPQSRSKFSGLPWELVSKRFYNPNGVLTDI